MDKLIEKYIELSCRVNDFFTIYNLPESERTDRMCGVVERLRGCEGPWSVLPTEAVCEDEPMQITSQSKTASCYKCGSRPNQDEPQYDYVTICPICKKWD